jgi:Na+/H+ antiporter NhaA
MSDTVSIAILTGVGFTVTNVISSFFAYRISKQSKETHILINSRMEQLLKLEKAKSLQEGVDQERKDRP